MASAFTIAHAMLWAILCAASYATAGPYSFASCLPVVFIYAPPLFFLVAGIAIASGLGLLAALLFPSLRGGWLMIASIHAEMFVAGLLVCNLAALVSAGQVSCL